MPVGELEQRPYMRPMPASTQTDLFENETRALLPEGVRYAKDVLSVSEQQNAVRQIAALELKPFEFQGFLGNRRVAAFGWRYDYNGGGFQRAGAFPEFLAPLRERAASFAGLEPEALEQILVT